MHRCPPKSLVYLIRSHTHAMTHLLSTILGLALTGLAYAAPLLEDPPDHPNLVSRQWGRTNPYYGDSNGRNSVFATWKIAVIVVCCIAGLGFLIVSTRLLVTKKKLTQPQAVMFWCGMCMALRKSLSGRRGNTVAPINPNLNPNFTYGQSDPATYNNSYNNNGGAYGNTGTSTTYANPMSGYSHLPPPPAAHSGMFGGGHHHGAHSHHMMAHNSAMDSHNMAHNNAMSAHNNAMAMNR